MSTPWTGRKITPIIEIEHLRIEVEQRGAVALRDNTPTDNELVLCGRLTNFDEIIVPNFGMRKIQPTIFRDCSSQKPVHSYSGKTNFEYHDRKNIAIGLGNKKLKRATSSFQNQPTRYSS